MRRFAWVPLLMLALVSAATGCKDELAQAGLEAGEDPLAKEFGPIGGASAKPKVPAPFGSASITPKQQDPCRALAPQGPWAFRTAKDAVSFQRFKTATDLIVLGSIDGKDKQDVTSVRLVDVNCNFHSWYLLQLFQRNKAVLNLHLQTTNLQPLELWERGVVATANNGVKTKCDLWQGTGSLKGSELLLGAAQTYTSLCGGRLVLRRWQAGAKTDLETVVEIARMTEWGSKKVEEEKEETLEKDPGIQSHDVKGQVVELSGAPRDAELETGNDGIAADDATLSRIGISYKSTDGKLVYGKWYETAVDGVYLSIVKPELISRRIMQSYTEKAADGTNNDPALFRVKGDLKAEKPSQWTALTFLVAFDQSKLSTGFSLGAFYPEITWSKGITEGDYATPTGIAEKRKSPAGPNGFSGGGDLKVIGSVAPHLLSKTVATFVGGFKAQHGTFMNDRKFGGAVTGPEFLATTLKGHHSGFIQDGVEFAQLMPDLATAIMTGDGSLTMKTWQESDDLDALDIFHARQNGVPIIQGYDEANKLSIPHPFVGRRFIGAWSGSATKELTSLRTQIGIQEHDGKRFAIYAYSSMATPSAQARIAQAYHMRYSMKLDMNQFVHVYMALYTRDGAGNVATQYLLKDFASVDKSNGRFLTVNDNRDFFYIMKK